MPDELRLLAAFALALILTRLTVPLAVALAWRTSFLDKPAGYKGHGRPTPYLGGAGVIAAFLVPAVLFGGGASKYAAIVAGALALLLVGTIDDRVGIGPLSRVLIEVVVAVVLWNADLGWSVVDSDAANLLLTVFWVVGIVNAFNLMDNMDGAASSVAAVSAAAVAILALMQDGVLLAALLLTLAAACAGFLPHNLARPSRIFLGDGGSMPVGLVVGTGVMVAGSHFDGIGLEAVLAAAPIVGLPILDTTLVVISRRRQGAQILSGGQDHLTHRLLRTRLGSARRVCAALVAAQVALCGLALAMFALDTDTIFAGTALYLLVGAWAIWMLEAPVAGQRRGGHPAHTTSPAPTARQSEEPVL